VSPTRSDVVEHPTPAASGRRGPSPVTIDPRIHRRRTEVARRVGRRRLGVLLALLVVTATATSGWFLLHGSLFSARVLRVIGSAHTPPATVLATAGLTAHPPLIDVDPGAAAARIERLPWVATASVHREWPDGVVVTVHERTPVAVVGLGSGAQSDQWAEVDRSGRVLSDVPAPPHLARLVTTGPPPAVPAPGGELGSAYDGALAVAASLPPAFAAQVAAVVVEPGGTVGLRLTTPISVELGSTSQLPAKYEDVAAVLAGAPLVAGDVIDVSVPESPVIVPG
jgi:cell division protein FtsQ